MSAPASDDLDGSGPVRHGRGVFAMRPLLLTAVALAASFGVACGTEPPQREDAGIAQPQPEDAGDVIVDVVDAGGWDAGGPPPIDAGPPPSNCTYDSDRGVRTCPFETFGVTTSWGPRIVHVATPRGPAPPNGFPAVVYFQGSYFPGDGAFTATDGSVFGQESLTQTVESLLNQGFVVVAPDAILGAFWQTNIPPDAFFWGGTADDTFMLALIEDLETNRFAAIDDNRLFAMGISSGGFMTSRIAVSYPGVFRALAIHSGSYAICGAVCVVPDLPADHPPTLFVHGGADVVVFPAIMEVYRDQLVDDGITTATVFVPDGGHEWLPEAVSAIPAFFLDNE